MFWNFLWLKIKLKIHLYLPQKTTNIAGEDIERIFVKVYEVFQSILSSLVENYHNFNKLPWFWIVEGYRFFSKCKKNPCTVQKILNTSGHVPMNIKYVFSILPLANGSLSTHWHGISQTKETKNISFLLSFESKYENIL